MTMKKTLIASAVMASIFIAPAAFAFKEYPAGEPVTMNEMELAAVYLQPIDMEPRGMGLPAAKADVHLEADGCQRWPALWREHQNDGRGQL